MSVRKHRVSSRFALQADRTTPAPGSFIDVAVYVDGAQLSASKTSAAIETEHRTLGPLYVIATGRNAQPGSLSMPIFPNMVGLFFSGLFDRDTEGDLQYLTAEHYWDASLQGSADDGEQFAGVLLDGMTLEFNRSTDVSALTLDMSAFVNAKRAKADGTIPTFTPSALDPYNVGDVLLDFAADLTSDSFGGDNASVQRVSLTYANQTELRNFRSNVDVALNLAWTQHLAGIPTMTIEVDLALDTDATISIDDGADLVRGGLRVAAVHPQNDADDGGGQPITETAVTAGANNVQTLLMADTGNLADGDVCMIQDPATGNFVVVVLENVLADVSVDIDTTDATGQDPRVTLPAAASLTVRNMAWHLTIPRMTLTGRSPLTVDGNQKIITLTYEAELDKSGSSVAASIVEYLAYNNA